MIASRKLFQRARKVLPGGVSSPVRAFKAVGGTPVFIERAAGCRMIDADGRELIDYIGSWGAAIAGHAHPVVLEAISRAAADGTSFGACSLGEVALAEEIIHRVPSVELVRFTNSGTEAVMSAVRLARAATGRDLLIKFDGNYHGHADALLVKAGSGAATLGLPDSPGVSEASASATLIARYNDLDSVGKLLNQYGQRVAAIIVEPVAGNMGVIPPQAGFLRGLVDLAHRWGALVIFDEVMTGFRVARGGAQQLYGVQPDLTTFGKIIGGGLPVGAVGGGRRLMSMFAPQGSVYSAGTFSGNPLVMAAGAAVLGLLDDAAYAKLERSSARLEAGLKSALEHAAVQRVGSMISVFGGITEAANMDDVRAADHVMYAAMFRGMLERGVHLPPGGYESWFVSLAHDDAAIDATVEAARTALDELREMALQVGW